VIRLKNVIPVKTGIHKSVVIPISYLNSCLCRNDIKRGHHGKIYSKNKLKRRDNEEELVKIIIKDENHKSYNPSFNIRKELGIMNIHHALLFPDADGVADFINSLEWDVISFSQYLEVCRS
jgi:hypothetical protein